MFSVIILDFDGFLNKEEKVAIKNFQISFAKAGNYYLWVVRCMWHEAHAGVKFHVGTKYMRCSNMKLT